MLLTRLYDLLSLSPTLLPSLFHCELSLMISLTSVHPSCSLQIADLYRKQQQIQNQGEKADQEDYY